MVHAQYALLIVIAYGSRSIPFVCINLQQQRCYLLVFLVFSHYSSVSARSPWFAPILWGPIEIRARTGPKNHVPPYNHAPYLVVITINIYVPL